MSQYSWEKRFGLSRNPFKDTLDTSLFFRTRRHEEALVKIRIGIQDRHALILLSGDSGTGKTMVSQVVLRDMENEKVSPAFVFVHPGMGKGPLLGAILKELDPGEAPRFTSQRVARCQELALEHFESGRRIVAVIDEAHFLKADALHILRTLSNLETEQEKLLTVLLIAERSLVRRLKSPSYASLRSRITFAVELLPLSFEETEQYVKFRLLKCGAPADLLDGQTYQALFELTGGVPREINRLLYNGFMESMAADEANITPEILRRAEKKMVFAHG